MATFEREFPWCVYSEQSKSLRQEAKQEVSPRYIHHMKYLCTCQETGFDICRPDFTHTHTQKTCVYVFSYTLRYIGVGILRFLYLPFSIGPKLVENVSKVTLMTIYPVINKDSAGGIRPQRTVYSTTPLVHATFIGAENLNQT